jgi:gluconokinase
MGVSGSGKTLVAEGLCARLGWPFQEGDALHPPHNIAKMSSGEPLTDEDRLPWLEKCRSWLAERARDGKGGILACSALKGFYRDILRQEGVDVTFLFLRVPREELERRLKGRKKHFMPATLLDSQLGTLEAPSAQEHILVLDAVGRPAEVISKAIDILCEDQEGCL